MAIRPRGSKYQVDVKVKGERVRESADTYDEAVRLEADIRASLLKGTGWSSSSTRPAAGSITLGKLAEFTREHVWSKQKAGDKTYANALLVVEALGADTPANTITTAVMDKFRERMAAKGNSDSTINRKLSALSKMLTEASRRGWVKARPHVPKTKEGQGRIRYLTQAEEEALLKGSRHLGHYDYADLWSFLIYTGARVGEALKVQRRDINMSARTVSFWDTKNGASRTIPLSKPALEALERRLAETKESPLAYPFGTVKARKVNAVWDSVKTRMGYEDDDQFVPHCLRHTCASRLVQNGTDLRVVKEWMGHKSLSTTLRYAHLAPKSLFAVVDNVRPVE